MEILFHNFLLHFQTLHKILNTLEKKMSLRGYLFLKLQTSKSGVTKMPKKLRVRALLESQHVKGSEKILSSAQ